LLATGPVPACTFSDWLKVQVSVNKA